MECSYIITQYNKNTIGKDNLTDEDKVNILSKIVKKKKYISYKDKQVYIKQLIKETISEKNNVIYFDSCERHYRFLNMLLKLYFNIQPDSYDMLAENDIVDYLFMMIYEEYQEFEKIMMSYVNDIVSGHLKLESL